MALEHALAEQKQAEANVKAASDAVVAAKTRIASNQAILTDPEDILKRAPALLAKGDVAHQAVTQQTASFKVAKAAVAQAQWALQRTIVSAPSGGRIGPVTARPGDYIGIGKAVLALVTDNDWRIVANVRERFLQSLEPGQSVWFNLGSQPWTWRRGKVRSLAAGISRAPEAPTVLPYVDPITDWIRLPRRFPVEIDLLGLEKQHRLFQGANASVLVIF